MEEAIIIRRSDISRPTSHEQLPMTEPEINSERRIVLHRGRRESAPLLQPLLPINHDATYHQRGLPHQRKHKIKRPTQRVKNRSPPRSRRLRIPELEQGHSSASSQIIRGRPSAADEGMKALLIYRAVLFATLCALAADTSCVFETELGRRVVQVL